MPRSPPPGPAAAAASPPPSKAKRRFDIESLLAKPEPPRRESPLPSAWAAAASRSPAALRFGCLAATLRFPALYLAAQQPFLSAPICRCAAPACQRPAAEPDFSRCTASLAPAPPWRPGAPCRMKRVRTVFTAEQLERLESEFLRQQYMVGSERLDLAAALQLSETQVKVWFQNRRIKWRKQSLEQKAAKLSSQFGMDPLAPSGPPDGQGSPREEREEEEEEEEEEDLKVDL